MKDIGITKDGGHIVEMTKSEHDEFVKLCMSVEGKPWPDFYMRNNFGFELSFDFSSTLEVIRAYYESRFKANEFHEIFKAIWQGFDNG